MSKAGESKFILVDKFNVHLNNYLEAQSESRPEARKQALIKAEQIYNEL